MNFGKENEKVEFKKSTGELHQAIESAASILNKHGSGIIYFGVADNGEVEGQQISDSTIKNVADAFTRDIEPKITPTIEELDYEGKSVLKVTFFGSQKPYSAFGKFQVRVGSQNRIMTRSEIIKLIKDEDYSYPWEKEPSDISLDDIDEIALKKYYSEAVACGRLSLDEYNKETLLTILELYKGGILSNAANALFGADANISLKVACFATNEKITFTDINMIKGNIYTLKNFAVTYILNHINWRAEISLKRVETPEIPVEAIREIVTNAFAHAIYEPTPEIEINIHPGKITIFNPGTFPEDLTPEDFINRSISSIKRNPLILDVLYRCKDSEKSGTGFKRVNELCSKAGVRWESEKTAYGFYFTFFRNNQNSVVEIISTPDLNETEQKVLSLIKENCKISRDDISKQIGKTVRSVQRITDSLVEKKCILRIGNNGFGYWQVLK